VENGGRGLVFESTTNARGVIDIIYASVLCVFICGICVCAFWVTFEAISSTLGVGDFDPSLGGTAGAFTVISLITILFAMTCGPSLSRVTLTFDGRLIVMRYPGGLSPRITTIQIEEVISVIRHEPRDNLSLRRIFGDFNPARAGIIVKTAGENYSINTDEFDKFAEVIKRYNPEVEISD
jgi:hypothetical protein